MVDQVKVNQMYNPAQYYANSYATQAMNGDEDFIGLNPMGCTAGFENNSTIFGNGMGLGGGMNFGGGMGFGGGMNFGGGLGMGFGGGMGMGMGYGPGSEVMNMTQEQYLKYQEKMENYQIDKQVRQQKRLANAEFSATAADDAVTRQIGILQRKIKNNEQDTVLTEYTKLVNSVKIKLKEGGYINAQTSDSEIKARAEKMYFEATGKSVTQDLTDNGDSGFVHGLKMGLGCGLGSLLTNKKDYQDNIAAITGEAKNSTTNTWTTIGAFISGGLTAALVAFGGRKGLKAIKG